MRDEGINLELTSSHKKTMFWIPVIISLAINTVGWVASGATAVAKQTETAERVSKLETKLDKGVPREELDIRTQNLKDDLGRVETRLNGMQQTLDAIYAIIAVHRK